MRSLDVVRASLASVVVPLGEKPTPPLTVLLEYGGHSGVQEHSASSNMERPLLDPFAQHWQLFNIEV